MHCLGALQQVVGEDALSIDAAIVGLGMFEAAERALQASDKETLAAVAAYVQVP